MKIRILIVGEARLLCNIVKNLLENEENMEAICATTLNDAVALLEKNYGDLVLVHSELGKKGGMSIVQTLAARYPALKIMVIDLPQSKAAILPYLERGASGYVLRNDSAQDMMKKIMAVYRGQPIICPDVAAAIINRLAEWANTHQNSEATQHAYAELTRREAEVLALLAKNLTNKEIARKLVIEVGTVKSHIHRILKKLNVRNRSAAAAYLPALQP